VLGVGDGQAGVVVVSVVGSGGREPTMVPASLEIALLSDPVDAARPILPKMVGAEDEVDELTPVTLTVEEAARVLGISRTLAYDLVTRGELPVVRLGRRIVVPRRALESLLDSAWPAMRSAAS
jgi:excisionase family DNA binding protein